MYIAYLAHIGGKVLIPAAVGIREDEDFGFVDFIDANGRVLVTFRRQDVAMHGFEKDMPAETFAAK
jgi:hypothetical protein